MIRLNKGIDMDKETIEYIKKMSEDAQRIFDEWDKACGYKPMQDEYVMTGLPVKRNKQLPTA